MKNKNCPHCKQTKPISDFSKRSDSKLGLMSWCRPCNRNKVKKWRLNNKEKCYANMLKWKRKNKVKVSAIQKRYRSNNPLNVRSTKMVCEARSKSLIKNLPFNIDFQYVLCGIVWGCQMLYRSQNKHSNPLFVCGKFGLVARSLQKKSNYGWSYYFIKTIFI